MQVGGVAAAAAAATGLTGLFNYNRANFQFDAPLRFQRFLNSRSFANAQMGQYREDLHGIAETTVTKMDTTKAVLACFLSVCAMLSCAGRVGIAGVAPPSWLCALYSGHIFMTVLHCGTALWLAFHASLRAQCAMTSLLTRKARLPIPNISQLDNARMFGSSFEYQNVRDIFRIPFMRHTEAAPQGQPVQGAENEEAEFGSTTRGTVPSWIRDEQVVDKGGGQCDTGDSTASDPQEAPEHFQLLAAAQEEWWQYDVYARIMLLYGVIQFLYAISYYSIAHTIAELRCFWIMWSLPMVFLCAQALILRLDIVRGEAGQHRLPHLEWAGHLAPYLAIGACTLEYRFTYSRAAVVVTWVLVLLTFFAHFLMALRLLDLAMPDWNRSEDMPEEAGKGWWPHHWKVPSAFSKALWIIAPPKKLEPGQNDLMREMETLGKRGGGISRATCRRRRRGPGGGLAQGSESRATAARAVKQRVSRLLRLFRWWFDPSVWPQIPEAGQQRLLELHGQYEETCRQLEQLGFDCNAPAGGEWAQGESSPRLAMVDHEVQDYGSLPCYVDKATGKTSFHMDDVSGATSIADVEVDVDQLADMLQAIGQGLSDVEGYRRPQYRSITIKDEEAEKEEPTAKTAYSGPSPFRQFGRARAKNLPWQVTRVAICTMAFVWVYMIAATLVELFVGPDSLMKAPGLPPWIRDQKNRHWDVTMIHQSKDQNFPQDYGLFKVEKAYYKNNDAGFTVHAHSAPHADHKPTNKTKTNGTKPQGPTKAPAGGHHRRLQVQETWTPEASDSFAQVLPSLDWLATTLKELHRQTETKAVTRPEPSFVSHPVQTLSAGIEWPATFEPQHLACAPRGPVTALTPGGLGALLMPSREGFSSTVQQFSLLGLLKLGPIVGTSWGTHGLHLVTATGSVVHCPGHGPQGKRWPCHAETHMAALPLPSGTQLLAAAMAKVSGTWIAALQLDDSQRVLTVLKHSSEGWRPAGELHLSPLGASTGRLSLSFSEHDLLIMTNTGEIVRRPLSGNASPSASPLSVQPSGQWEFQASCVLPAGSVLRLGLHPQSADPGSAWGPHLL